jgi:hypothetical protein
MPFRKQLARKLANVGLLPEHACHYAADELFHTDDDLLPCMLEIARSSECGPAVRVIERAIQSGVELRLTTKWQQFWLGPRLVFISMRPRFCHYVGVASSRLGLDLDRRDNWFEALRTIVLRNVGAQQAFVTASESSTHRYLARCVSLFGGKCLPICEPSEGTCIETWLSERLLRLPKRSPRDSEICLSPQLEPCDSSDVEALPHADRLIAAFADRLFVLHVRPGGHIQRMVQCALRVEHRPTGIFVNTNQRLVPSSILHSLLDQGAIGWHPMAHSDRDSPSVPTVEGPTYPPAQIAANPPSESWKYLTHWTRRQTGPWIDQDEDDYLDELILGAASKDRSALASLARIVVSQTILAKRSTRSECSVVSFTEVPLAEWAERRCYRAHRHRWDFEPYGICIDRDWLRAKSTRRVIYGPRGSVDQLPPQDRPFFQVQKSVSQTGGRVIDWTSEREWRHMGDVDLSDLSAADGLVFVPTQEEAQHIARVSRWPVTVLQRGTS